MTDFIEITKKEINDNVIYFTSDHTTYIQEYKKNVVDTKELLKRCTALCKQLKVLGCKVSHKNKGRLFVKENADQYLKESQEYLHNFGMAKSYAEWITSKPLPIGTSENEELKTMYKFTKAISELDRRDTVFSKINEFESRISNLEQEVLDGDFSYSKIVL